MRPAGPTPICKAEQFSVVGRGGEPFGGAGEKDDGRVEVSLRARPSFDVSAVALALGGGGHPQAAGCTMDGPLDAAVERVVAALKSQISIPIPKSDHGATFEIEYW